MGTYNFCYSEAADNWHPQFRDGRAVYFADNIKYIIDAVFEFLAAVIMTSSAIWDTRPCIPAKVFRNVRLFRWSTWRYISESRTRNVVHLRA
jgi:hypothetical protein